MRTTVTLDDDVVAALRRIERERGVSFEQALNDAIRAGLRRRAPAATSYRTPSRRLGLRPGIDLTKAMRLAADLEDGRVPGLRGSNPLTDE